MQYRILGSLEVISGGARLPVGGARAECVLATLLLEANKVVPVQRLVEAAWDRDPPATAGHQVRKIIAELRRSLPGGARSIVTEGPGYRLLVTDEQWDLGLFEARLRLAGRAEAAGETGAVIKFLQQALDLWRGPALAGLASPLIAAACAVLDERRLTATERLVELRLESGQARELIADLRGALVANPLRETTRGQLMLALYRSGRQAEALRVYEEGRRLLAEELGIDPAVQLRLLHERILRRDPALDGTAEPSVHIPAPRAPHALPHDLGDFVGREEELRQIAERLRAPAPGGLSVIGIDGMPGVGKTALMLHVAHRFTGRFPDGQLFVDLHGFSDFRRPLEPGQVLDILLRECGVPVDALPPELPARAAIWRARVAGRRMLVLLDNVADVSQVRPVLPGTPDCQLLITGRSRVTALDGALQLSLDPLPPGEAAQLATLVIGRNRAAREPGDVEALVQACGGLPLAVRNAANRLHNRPQWSIRHMVQRLRTGGGLHELSVGDRSVVAGLRLSYHALDDGDRRAFRLLGLLPCGEFDGHALAALADLPLGAAEALLERLLDGRLVTEETLGRFRVHEIVYRFARDVAEEADGEAYLAAARRRLLDYYLRAAIAAAGGLESGCAALSEMVAGLPPRPVPEVADRGPALSWFDAERRALIAAVRLAESHGLDEHACHLPRALATYLQLRGRTADLLAVLETAVSAARRLGDPELEGRCLSNLSIPYWHLGRLREALDCARKAQVLVEAVGDPVSQGVCLGRIAMLLNSLGRHDEAVGHYERALDVYRRVEGDDRILVELADAQAGVEDFTAAESSLRRAVRVSGTPLHEAIALTRHADLSSRLARHDQAFESGMRALDVLGNERPPVTLAALENILGRVHHARGEYRCALQRHRQARELAEDADFRPELAQALTGIARALFRLHDIGSAVTHWRLALVHCEEMGIPEADVIRQDLEAVG